MKTLLLTIALVSLLGLTACGGGSDGGSAPRTPCDALIAEMIEYLGEPDGPPTVVELNGDTGLFYSYVRHGGDVGLFYGPSFDGCEADIFVV